MEWWKKTMKLLAIIWKYRNKIPRQDIHCDFMLENHSATVTMPRQIDITYPHTHEAKKNRRKITSESHTFHLHSLLIFIVVSYVIASLLSHTTIFVLLLVYLSISLFSDVHARYKKYRYYCIIVPEWNIHTAYDTMHFTVELKQFSDFQFHEHTT